MRHLDSGLLNELLDGEIPSAELLLIQQHLAGCEECRARLEAERRLADDVAGLVATIEVPDDPGNDEPLPIATPAPAIALRRRWLPPLAWAATILLAVGIGYVARGREPRHVAPPTSAVAVAPVAAGLTANVPLPSPVESTTAATTPPPATVRRRPEAPRPAAAALAQARVDSSALDAGIGRRADLRDQPAAKSASGAPEPAPPTATIATAATTRSAVSRSDSATRVGGRLQAPASARLTGSLEQARRGEDVANSSYVAARQRLDSTLPAPEPIMLPDAIRRLGGTLHLIDGLIPLRLEWRDPYVRVVYPAGAGELVLQQQLIDGRVVFQLVAPAGFPADSLARLRDRIKE